MDDLIKEVNSSWGWIGLESVRVFAENDFGNLIIEDADGGFWRICPEECFCKKIAGDRDELNAVIADPEFAEDWEMLRIVQAARETCGPLEHGRKYALKIPGCLGGEYVAENFATAPLQELVGFSGSIAHQTKDLPNGARIELKVINHPEDVNE